MLFITNSLDLIILSAQKYGFYFEYRTLYNGL